MPNDEPERAAHYEQSKDDPADWEEPEQPDRPRRRLGVMFSVRLQPDELDSIRVLAARRGMSVSAFLRDAALNAVAAEPVISQCETCGRSWTSQADVRICRTYVHICTWPSALMNTAGSLDQVARIC